MEHFPYEKYRFRILTIERPGGKLSKLLMSHGYEKVCTIDKNIGETLWVSTLDKDSLDLTSQALPKWCFQ